MQGLVVSTFQQKNISFKKLHVYKYLLTFKN
ncbi:Uncharacterised protein [Flavobacterium hibernum]|nr:Uncharacterised protein [Flavobacterium hibernum]